KLRKAVDVFTKRAENKLTRSRPTKEEWRLVDEVLDVLKAASKKFSASTPNIAMVIPVMDSIDDKLLAIARDRNHHPAIRIATLKAKNLLNKYYALTDASNIYRIAIRKSDMLFFTSLSSDCSQPPLELHPWFRGRYFELRKWPIEWRRAARLAR
ncbi:hypothetical protein BDV98DRAFT_514612, partial [Pterulicium gracile]